MSASGPRYTDFVTQWPSAFSAAASFDIELIEERAKKIGEEFRGKGINVALAPVSWLKRVDLVADPSRLLVDL
jgi:beta-glucosidase